MHGRMVDLWRYRTPSGERNFVQRIKAPIFLEAVLAIEIMQEPQSNLEKKLDSSILKDDDPSILRSIAPELLEQSNKTS